MDDLEIHLGRDRKVIIYWKKIVIKIATNSNGLIQNYNEFMLNKKRPDITAKVLFYGGEFIIMEYVEPFNRCKNKKERQEFNHVLTEIIKEIGDSIDNYQLGHNENGKLVIYDYGHNEHFIKETETNK